MTPSLVRTHHSGWLLGLLATAFVGACSSSSTGGGGNDLSATGGKSSKGTGGAPDDSESGGAPSGAGTTSKGSGGALTTAADAGSGCNLASATKPCGDDPDPCGLNSGWAGDEYCMLPPPEGEGIQIHLGPKSYTDPDEVAKYVLKPGQEFNSYAIANIPLTEDRWYNHVKITMRPGSHHLINTVVQGKDLAEGYLPEGSGCSGTTLGGFPGTQNLYRDMPPNGIQAPENVGLGSKLAGNSSLCLNHHTYNFGDSDELREVWINVYFVDESEVTQKSSAVTLVAGPFQGIQPHTTKVLSLEKTIDGTGRITSLFGHRHAWTDRFAVWKNDELVYDSWNWVDSVVYDYDSITTNPAPDPDAKTDGATSGVLEVNTGDKIKIECDVNNKSDKTLTFRNALYDGEMCILFGSSVGVAVTNGLPTAAPN